MGQYFIAVNVNTLEFCYSRDYDNGSKMMDHNYMGNRYVGAVMKLLSKNQPWYKCKLCWAGDYAKKKQEDFFPGDAVLTLVSKMTNGEDTNLYDQIINTGKKIIVKSMSPKIEKKRFILNHSKMLYIDCSKIKEAEDGFTVHPLPILCSDGNGQGGGDYHGFNEELAGDWCGDVISVENTKPAGEWKLFDKVFEEKIETFKY
jgi:hypothetical protein